MSQRWTACYTQPGAEAKVRAGIEEIGFGTFLPTYAKCWYRDGRLRAQERPLMPRYILVAIDESNRSKIGEIHRELIEGVDHLLGIVSETEVGRLMLAHATGAYNVVQMRDASGRFSQGRKQKKRRRRPRHGKTYRNSTSLSGTPTYGMAHG